MNPQQKKWEKEQKRRLAKKERAAEAATHVVKDEATDTAAPPKARETSHAGNSPVKVARHQAPLKPVHKQGTQRGG